MSADLDIRDFGPCTCTIWKNYARRITVPHWRSLVESKYLSHFELQGHDVTVRIKSIKFNEVTGSGGKVTKKALVSFEGKEKSAVMGVTCLKTIAGMYGDDYDLWIGKRITIFPTTTQASGETVGTIRVRPKAPDPEKERA